MITYDPETKTIYMGRVDLEHCGFNQDDYSGELWVAGIVSGLSQWPDKLVVDMTQYVRIGTYCEATQPDNFATIRAARGILQWDEGDELAEDTIRRIRGG